MTRKKRALLLAVPLALVAAAAAGGYLYRIEFVGAESYDEDFYATVSATPTAAGRDAFTWDDYAAVLDAHVNDRGMVDYAGLKANRGRLDKAVRAMAALDLETYRGWNEDRRLAFWINAYNALTLKVIVDRYPIEAGLLSGLAYPKNSIRQIPGVWTKIEFLVMGRKLTLDEIEHAIMRGQDKKRVETFGRFDEPRIHMALVCAAMSCPPLRGEPFRGDELDAQLDDRTKRFLADAKKFRIDRDAGVVHLSSIFKWFGGDFAPTYTPKAGFESGGDAAERAVLRFVAGYLPKEDADYLKRGDYDVKYLDYDWSLNEWKMAG